MFVVVVVVVVVVKSGNKKLTAEKGNLLADHCGNAITNFLNDFQSKASCFVIFRYKFLITQGNFQSGL